MDQILPWYHIYGQTCELLAGCIVGSKAYVLPSFDLKNIADTITRGRPNMVLGVPTMFVNILNSPQMKDVDMSCLKFANCGAGALPDELALEWERRTGFRMAEGYGLSETSTGAITAPVWSKLKRGSVGHPFANRTRAAEVTTPARLTLHWKPALTASLPRTISMKA